MLHSSRWKSQNPNPLMVNYTMIFYLKKEGKKKQKTLSKPKRNSFDYLCNTKDIALHIVDASTTGHCWGPWGRVCINNSLWNGESQMLGWISNSWGTLDDERYERIFCSSLHTGLWWKVIATIDCCIRHSVSILYTVSNFNIKTALELWSIICLIYKWGITDLEVK